MYKLKERYNKEVRKHLKEKWSYKNEYLIPELEKIVINRGMGESVNNSKIIESTVEQFIAITGQKPVLAKAKKSISNFKLREGNVIGCKVTLRGKKMYDFLTKLINLALPKIRDFKGINPNSFDGRGNYTMGIKEDIIFPEVSFEKVDQIRGMDITFVTSAETDHEAFDLLKAIGFPFRDEISKKKQIGENNG